METAIACIASFFAGMVFAVLLFAVIGHMADPDDDSEVNGPGFL